MTVSLTTLVYAADGTQLPFPGNNVELRMCSEKRRAKVVVLPFG